MQYDLVFEGGGAKGFAFVGALQAFKEARHTPGRVLGTSAGAITATLLAAGFDIDDLGGALGERAADGRPSSRRSSAGRSGSATPRSTRAR